MAILWFDASEGFSLGFAFGEFALVVVADSARAGVRARDYGEVADRPAGDSLALQTLAYFRIGTTHL